MEAVLAMFWSSTLYKGLSAFDRRQRFVGNMNYDLRSEKGVRCSIAVAWSTHCSAVHVRVDLRYLHRQSGHAGIHQQSGNYLPAYTGSAGARTFGFATLRDNCRTSGATASTRESELDDQQPGRLRLPGAVHVRQCGKTRSRRSVESAPVSVRKEFPLKERMRLQIRFDFQNPFKWYNWGNIEYTVDLKNVVAGTSTPTPANLFGKIPPATRRPRSRMAAVPMMNATIKFVW